MARPPRDFPQRTSAWLADIEDWDADDAEVFMLTLKPVESRPVPAREHDAAAS